MITMMMMDRIHMDGLGIAALRSIALQGAGTGWMDGVGTERMGIGVWHVQYLSICLAWGFRSELCYT